MKRTLTLSASWAGVVTVVGGLGLAINWASDFVEKDQAATARFDSLVVRVDLLERNMKAVNRTTGIRVRDGRIVQMPPREGLFTRFRRALF